MHREGLKGEIRWLSHTSAYTAELLLSKLWRLKGFFNLKSSQMSYSSLFDSFEYLCYGSTAVKNILILLVRDRLYKFESGVYRRQILTFKDGTRAERVDVTIDGI